MSKTTASPLVRRLLLAAVLITPLWGGAAFAAGDISFHAEQAYPEGIAWSPQQKFFS